MSPSALATPSRRSIPPPLVLLLCALMAAAGAGTTLLVWFVLLTPAEPETPTVSFDEFLAEVHGGRVSEVRIDGTTYAFRVFADGQQEQRRTSGPRPDIAAVRALRPSDPGASPPKVFFAR